MLANFAALNDRGITDVRPSFGAVLVPLFREDGLRLGELAERGSLSKQTVTSLVKRLEDLGYVERRADPEDGRAMRISLTDSGHRMKQAVRESVEEVDKAYQTVLDAQEEWGLHKATRPVEQHGTYSFMFWDMDDNCWEILSNPPRGYMWIFEQGDLEGKGHFERGFHSRRPDNDAG